MKTNKLITFVLVLTLVVCTFSGCGSIAAADAGTSKTAAEASQADTGTDSDSEDWSSLEITCDDSDTNTSYDDSAVSIVFSDQEVTIDGSGASASGSVVTITQAGTYVLSGSCSDGELIIDADSEDTVHLILNGCSITNTDGPAICGSQSEKIIVTLAANSENSLTDSSTYSDLDDSEEPDATLFSKDDLTLNGTGSLQITGNYNHGIHSKDGLLIIDGTISITSSQDAVNGKDYVGIFGGTLTLQAGDDGVHTDGKLLLEDGVINITQSTEGLEGAYIEQNGGSVTLTSSDDGLNATDGSGSMENGGPMNETSSNTNVAIVINAGTLTIDSNGDAIDSNGNLAVNGGSLTICGPVSTGNGILDYDGTGVLTAGTILASGSSDMYQTFSEDSGQCSLSYGFSSSMSAGTCIALKDDQGNTLLSLTPSKDFSAVLLSSSDLIQGSTYMLYVNDTLTEEITLTDTSTCVNLTSGQNTPGSGGGGRGNRMQKSF